MKKTLLFLICISVSFCMMGQNTVTNPGFEQWSNEMPVGWTTNVSGNIMTEFFGQQIPIPISVNFGSRTTDAHSGSYALSLQSKNIAFSSYSYAIPGIAQLGSAGAFEVPLSLILALIQLDTANFDFEELASLLSISEVIAKGAPFTQVPSSMKAWVKYLPEEGSSDSMNIVAYLTKWNPTLNLREPVAVAYYSSGEIMNNYTQIEVPFFYESDLTECDTMTIIVSSCGVMGSLETTLIIDDISFEYGSGIDNHTASCFSIYPNPASDFMMIEPEDLQQSYSVAFYDVIGKRVLQQNNLTGKHTFDVSSLPKGVYLIKTVQNGSSKFKKVVVE